MNYDSSFSTSDVAAVIQMFLLYKLLHQTNWWWKSKEKGIFPKLVYIFCSNGSCGVKRAEAVQVIKKGPYFLLNSAINVILLRITAELLDRPL